MKSFNADHPTVGAGASLVLGQEGCDAIIRNVEGDSHAVGLFIGVRQAPSLPWRILPLHAPGFPAGAESFETLSGARYGRTFALASDRWLIGPLVFKLCTPFWKTSDPATCDLDAARLHFAPSIGGFVEYDNTHSEEPVEVIVGAGASGAAFRPAAGPLRGFNSSDRFGFATAGSDQVRLQLGDSPFNPVPRDSGDFASIVFTIPARTKRVFPFAIGFNDAAGDSLCRSIFGNLNDVLADALATNSEVIRRSDELDAEWFARPGTREEKVERAHAVRAHLAKCLIKGTSPVWTLSGPVDDGFSAFDREFFPWAESAKS